MHNKILGVEIKLFKKNWNKQIFTIYEQQTYQNYESTRISWQNYSLLKWCWPLENILFTYRYTSLFRQRL